MQTQSARSLGPQIEIGEGLVVQPPLGWTQDPRSPNRFLETVRIGTGQVSVEREIRFVYQRRPELPTAYDAIRERLPQFGSVDSFEAARIGPLDGLQIVGERQFSFNNRQQLGQEIFRLAFSPQGHEILIHYKPVREVTPGDLALFDAICEAVTLRDVRRGTDFDVAEIGIDLPDLPGTRRTGPDLPGVPATYLEGYKDGLPLWSIGLRRTWLTRGTPEELLAARVGPDPRLQYRRREIEVGRRLVLNVTPGPRRRMYLVYDGPDRAAFLEVGFSPNGEEAALAAADRLIEGMTFATPFPQAVEKAVQNGANLVERLVQPAALRQWAGSLRTDFLSEVRADGPGTLVLQFGPDEGGYAGVTEREFNRQMERVRWQLEPGGGYSLLFETGRRGAPPEFVVQQVRASDSRRVEVVERFQGRRERTQFEVDRNFLCRPLVFVAASWVAQQPGGNWVVTRNSPGSERTTERLMQTLPVDAEGRARVLLLDAVRPTGRVLTFDSDGSLLFDRSRRWTRQKISIDDYRRRTGSR